jgi:hypothetical protein
MKTRLLSEEEFQKTFGKGMIGATTGESPPFDFWQYFDAIEASDFQHCDCSEGKVEYVYREPYGKFEHVLVGSDRANVFMVLVLDRPENKVIGHCLLNLNQKYGLET